MIYNCGIIGYGVMGQIRHDTCNLIEEFQVKKFMILILRLLKKMIY